MNHKDALAHLAIIRENFPKSYIVANPHWRWWRIFEWRYGVTIKGSPGSLKKKGN